MENFIKEHDYAILVYAKEDTAKYTAAIKALTETKKMSGWDRVQGVTIHKDCRIPSLYHGEDLAIVMERDNGSGQYNGINSLEELQKEEYEYTIFSYNGKHEIKLLRQCMYKVMGAKSDRTAYKPYGRRQKIGIYCTKAQKIEIELEFEFYRNVFYEELSTFMDAFIQAQKIFPEDAPVGDYDEFNERDMKIAFMATGIERRSRAAMIEESEAGNEKTKTTGS